MKQLVLLVPLLTVLAQPAVADGVESTPKTITLDQYSENIDKMRGDIDYWTELSNLEATKKSALKDKYENIILEKSIVEIQAETDPAKLVEEPIRVDDQVLTEAEFYQSANTNGYKDYEQTISQQMSILSETGSAPNEPIPLEHGVPEPSFVNGVVPYASIDSQDGNSDSDQLANIATLDSSEPVDSNYNNSAFSEYGAKIVNSTSKYTTLAFAIRVAGAKNAIYLTKKVNVGVDVFDLHMFGGSDVPVEIISRDRRSVTMEIDGQTVIAE